MMPVDRERSSGRTGDAVVDLMGAATLEVVANDVHAPDHVPGALPYVLDGDSNSTLGGGDAANAVIIGRDRAGLDKVEWEVDAVADQEREVGFDFVHGPEPLVAAVCEGLLLDRDDLDEFLIRVRPFGLPQGHGDLNSSRAETMSWFGVLSRVAFKTLRNP